MKHFKRWVRRALSSSSLLPTGYGVPVPQSTGFTCGNCREGVRFTSTTAYTVLIPLSARRLYQVGWVSGKPSYKAWEIGLVPICGYERTGHITEKGTQCYKHTHKKYVNRSLPTCQATVPVLRISIRWTRHPHTTLSAGGGVAVPPLNCYEG